MPDDDLKRLLRKADAGLAERRVCTTAESVLERLQQRRRQCGVRRTGVALVLSLAAGLAWTMSTRSTQVDSGVLESASEATADHQELARRADFHSAVAAGLQQIQALEASKSQLAELEQSATSSIWEYEVARSASLVWQHAEFLRQENGVADARARYHEVTQRFPRTFWAELAQQRLDEPDFGAETRTPSALN